VYKDCERCGVFGAVDDDGVCFDCIAEDNDEQEEDEKAEIASTYRPATKNGH
jgi:hypothetical protein